MISSNYPYASRGNNRYDRTRNGLSTYDFCTDIFHGPGSNASKEMQEHFMDRVFGKASVDLDKHNDCIPDEPEVSNEDSI